MKELPPRMQAEVRDFVEFLIARQGPSRRAGGPAPSGSFEELFGSWDSGDENSADNERIDADLAREYADPHEPGV
ncbi:MAG: DUF2281 domain-containing protein [Acidobacteriota bacterium]|nr:DUF2281 domain-containing protein [Acidobacteriota bacterium]MDQ5838526.1 DUF2281 domain-containing protein [Acidobacteriota bacterium]